ncbi:MAG: (Fe-S)-binding protein [Acidobacteria bacterium]|nr:(Fe-S)-binding protein [Acidobacteriota bacterium]
MTETRTQKQVKGFVGDDKPSWDDYARCVHCGLCLNHCPTYRLWGMEADSPRGRIRQMLLVDRGELELGDGFVTHIDRCLDCRACETACPSGVEYGKLVEFTRAQIEQQHPRGLFSRLARDAFFRYLLPHPRSIDLAARLTKIYQRSGLAAFARATGILKLLGLDERERLMPRIDDRFFFSELGKTFPAQGPRRARVAFFAGCIAQVTFTKLNEATIRVLTANGCEVVVPDGQLCCGALALHAGVRDVARELARNNLEAFLRESFDAVVTNAAGCGSTLKEYPQLFQEGDAEYPKAIAFQAKMRDVTEFLADLGLAAPLKELPLRVTYQDSCHLAHGQRIREAPRKLICAVPGVELVEMFRSDDCCGSAGIYNVTETAASMEILEEKMRYAMATKAPVIVTANPGCLLQLRAGAAMHGTKQEVLHVVELLDRTLAS